MSAGEKSMSVGNRKDLKLFKDYKTSCIAPLNVC